MRKYSYCGSCFNEALRWAASFVVSRIRKTAALSGNFDCSTNCRNPAQFSPIYFELDLLGLHLFPFD